MIGKGGENHRDDGTIARTWHASADCWNAIFRRIVLPVLARLVNRVWDDWIGCDGEDMPDVVDRSYTVELARLRALSGVFKSLPIDTAVGGRRLDTIGEPNRMDALKANATSCLRRLDEITTLAESETRGLGARMKPQHAELLEQATQLAN